MDLEESNLEERTYDETLEYILPFSTLEKHGFRQEVEVFCNCLMPEMYNF